MQQNYLPVGNQYISIPKLNEDNAAIEDVTFLHMMSKGLLNIQGDASCPLMIPFVETDGIMHHPNNLEWRRLSYWIPTFSWNGRHFEVEGVILAPIDERGFIYRLNIKNSSEQSRAYKLGLEGRWASSWHCVNENKRIDGTMNAYQSNWNNSFVFDMRCGLPLFSFAPITDTPCLSTFHESTTGFNYCLCHETFLHPNESKTFTFYWGFGFEEVAAATSAKEMMRQGFTKEIENTLQWLESRICRFADKSVENIYNTNLFFCIFFSTGHTLDTEELVLVTSRSPRYYVSAAYWDRDSLLWSFPAILDADPELARELLLYVFGRQRRNIGTHSRYIDGTVLEPGFELDELMAPILALERYIDKTKDREIIASHNIISGIRDILKKLETRRHPSVALYSTFLQPTDDEIVYPYLTYNNVLVWKALNALVKFSAEWSGLSLVAEDIRQSIQKHCIKTQNGKPFFSWSIDLEGNYDIYDEPPGSLQLLPYLGFCDQDDIAYKNTIEIIRSPEYAYSFYNCEFGEIGCPHAPHPWLLSVANSLLSGRVEESLDFLRRAKMDNGIVCESIDENTGECATGEAFATCAGFVCHAIRAALGKEQA